MPHKKLKKVLIITYYWPPAGGPGVQRVLKFAKYLPEFGWQPIILTVKTGEFPAIDNTLEKDIPKECIVYKTNSWEPTNLYKNFAGMKKGEKIPVAVLSEKNLNWKRRIANWVRLNLFIPDAKIGWIPFAVKKGRKIIKKHQPDMIFSSSPPPTVHLIAKKLAKWSGTKWVADFRDPWTQIHYYCGKRSSFSKWLDGVKEKQTVNSANWLTAASRQFIALIGADIKQNTTVITNGFDQPEVPVRKQRNPKFTIVHIGSINRNRFYPAFYRGIRSLLERGLLSSENFVLRFAGKIESSVQNEIADILKPYHVTEFMGYIPHDQAMYEMCSGDLLLLFLENVRDYAGHIPGKLFEYMITGNYILGVGNRHGEAAAILHETDCGRVIDPTDDFSTIIGKLFIQWKNRTLAPRELREFAKYSRYELTRQLVSVFERVL
ncbi:MAG: glycosyltransferase [Fidelibacterota bacterium]